MPALVRSLEEYEQIIERGLATFVDVGNALIAIRDEKLYLESHDTFEEYCKQRWFISRPRAYELMSAAEVVGTVSAIADTGDVAAADPAPKNEAVARELGPLRQKPDALRDAWDEAVERHGEQPTAKQVREVVRERSGQTPEAPPEPGPEREPVPPTRDMAVHFSSATDEWATPQPVFDMLAREFPFELDVCALDSSAKCERYFTPELDGLAHDWRGVCWMNPPYGREIGKWVAKARESANENGATVVCLLPARVDTGWWWDHCRYGEVRFLRGRLKFGDATAGAPFPSAVVVFKPNQLPSVQWWDRDVEEAARVTA